MFGVIISSRPVLTEAQTISDTQIAFTIPAAPAFSHIVVFLLPGQQLPLHAGAAVYLQMPGQTEFQFLGAIANDKPSAIFKVNKADAASLQPDAAATLGISLEPVAQIQQSLANLKAGGATSQQPQPTAGNELVLARPNNSNPVTTKLLAQRIIANAYNFLASFSGNVGPNGIEVVPLKSFQDWWRKFEKRVEMDPGFLEREQD